MKSNKKLKPEDLLSLEAYERERPNFRKQMMAHKKTRIMAIGPHASMHFEDRKTMQYQIQEILKAERVTDLEGIDDELHAYNPLIPDGTNWKATFMIEYEDVEERKRALTKMIGIEDKICVYTEGSERIWAIADEDLERETEEKTSSVHFLRFEFPASFIHKLKSSPKIFLAVTHPFYTVDAEIPQNVRESLLEDLE